MNRKIDTENDDSTEGHMMSSEVIGDAEAPTPVVATDEDGTEGHLFQRR